jgi:CheY-like chemotaxis protein
MVEDNELIRELVADVLHGLGYEVTPAVTAEEALLQLDDLSVSLLLTDVRLPGAMNGIALAQVARRRRPNIKIMLIGADLGESVPQELSGIADDVLRKPFTIPEFEERLSKLGQQCRSD